MVGGVWRMTKDKWPIANSSVLHLPFEIAHRIFRISQSAFRIHQRTLWYCLILLLLASCARPSVRPVTPGMEQEGFASYYGAEFHGRRTSSGEVFNMHDLTAAHREFPLGTWIMVTNLSNGRSVEVRVNDRGPFVSDRIVDVSYAAGKLLGMIGPGVVPVRVAVTRLVSSDGGGPPRLSVRYAVQVASFVSPENARTLEGKLSEEFSDVEVVRKVVGGDVYYRVWLGNFIRRVDAESMAEKLAARGLSVLIIERDR